MEELRAKSGGHRNLTVCSFLKVYRYILFFMLKIISINIRGMGSVGKIDWLKDICTVESPLFLGLQESKTRAPNEHLIDSFWKSSEFDFASVKSDGRSGGIISVWDKNVFEVVHIMEETSCLVTVGRWINKECLVGFINVYGPRDEAQRKILWHKIQSIMSRVDAKWCILGDFNEVRNTGERFNSNFSARGAEEFNKFISDENLRDIAIGGRKFTRISDDGVKFSKLDRFLVSDSFLASWPDTTAVVLDRKISDHCPIMLTERNLNFGPKPFRFFNVWLKEKDMVKVVKEAWNKSVKSTLPDKIFMDKLKNVKKDLKEWSNTKFRAIENEIDKFKDEANYLESVAEERSLNEEEAKRWREARRNWLQRDGIKNRMIKQKARIKWALEGDENSKYFHSVMRKRRTKNNIKGLMVDGRWCEDPRIIKKTTFGFFKNMFEEKVIERPSLESSLFNRISEEEARVLEVGFTESEVWNAVRGCGSSKSPGPDGFNFKFIKFFWDIIKPDLLRAISWFWENDVISNGCNSSFVSLIPKNNNPIGLGEFRPISLIGVYYKIIAKMLAERLKKVIGKVVGKEQNAFISGRSILDSVLIANEAVLFLKKEKIPGLIFKVDFEKAYDCVNWNFLMDCMKKMGFGNKWSRWIRSCLESTKISILVNGSPTDEFKVSRGIRQGDPLSPFLFLMVAEGLNVAIKEAVGNGIFEGVRIGRGGRRCHICNMPMTLFSWANGSNLMG